MAAQVNQQKQFEEINRAAMFSRIQAQARPSVQQMGMVSDNQLWEIQFDILFTLLLVIHSSVIELITKSNVNN